ncbi:MAG: HlyC/CorC family transporter [Polyangiaceae bacterium]|nr:HlyC/CorC family transporter [Polyangiaceae bacterium]
MDPFPPELVPALLLAAIPATLASIFGAASASLAALPGARKAALADALAGKAQAALERYVAQGYAIETRWTLLRVFCIASSAVLCRDGLQGLVAGTAALVLAATFALVIYGAASQISTALAEREPERSAVFLLRLLQPLEWLIYPLALPFVALGALLGRSQRLAPVSTEVAEAEVELIVNEGEQTGALDHEQSEMIRNVLDFRDLTAGEVMVPRTTVTAFEVGIDIQHLLARVIEEEHSRYPVYRQQIDNVVGVLHVKDLIRHVAAHGVEAFYLDDLMRKPPVFVPASQSASSVLRDMRIGRQHLAVVIDEFGGMNGIVTLEDLIEEIVGDIRDEHDNEEPPIAELGDGRLLVDASVAVSDLSRYLGSNLPVDGDYNSLGGFLTERLGRVPTADTTLEEHGLRFVVREANERRVLKVEIVRLTQPPLESLRPSGGSSRPAA